MIMKNIMSYKVDLYSLFCELMDKGQNNDNYKQLMAFANKVNNAADKLYPGFSGRIIEKEYRYNEYVADKYLLLEVGNNQNNIAEVKKTGLYFARVLADVLEEE